MKLYHFSDAVYKVGDKISIGNFGKFINKQKVVVRKFEALMEERRKALTPNKPSRLNCIFAFNKGYAEDFITDRKFLYELEIPETLSISEHNYNVGTYFTKIFEYEDYSLIERDIELINDYWRANGSYLSYDYNLIDYDQEYLIPEPVIVSRIINLK